MDLLEHYHVTNYFDGFNMGFLLMDNTKLSMTDYRVMKAQMKDGLVRCEKLLFNGRIKLLYMTENYRTLEEVLLEVNEPIFLGLLSDVLRVISDIRENGFLEVRNLLLNPSCIFVDEIKMKVQLIYLPVEHELEHISVFEGRWKEMMELLITSNDNFPQIKKKKLQEMFRNETLSLKDLSAELERQIWKLSHEVPIRSITEPIPPECNSGIRNLVMVSSSPRLKFHIEKRDFVIGREVVRVDGIIRGRKTVGRQHCKIKYKNGKYYMEDLRSKNGTFVDGKRVVPGQEVELSDQSQVQVADVNFFVKYE